MDDEGKSKEITCKYPASKLLRDSYNLQESLLAGQQGSEN